MDAQKKQHFKEILQQQKKGRLNAELDEQLGLRKSIRDTTSELSSYDNHPGDLGTETFEAEKNFSFRINNKYFVSEIEEALQKIEKGNYGVCESCGTDIGEERLEIVPYARLCSHCEEVYRKKPTNDYEDGRPIEEQVLFPPFGRSFTDRTMEDKVEYDGEDAWQDVNLGNVMMSDNDYDDEDSFGYVEDVEQISNQQYRRQLE